MADKPGSGIGFGYVVLMGLLIIVFVVTASIAAIYYKQAHDCNINPNIKCFNDYSCPYALACGATAPAVVCSDGSNIAALGDSATCWPGVTGIYFPLNDVCRYGPTGVPAAFGCTCAWTGQGAATNCLPPIT